MYIVKVEHGYNVLYFTFDDGSEAATFGLRCIRHNNDVVISITYADIPDKFELQEGDDD